MKYRDMKQAVDMFVDEWDLGKSLSLAKGNVCGWIYLLGILKESEKIICLKDKSKLIGFCGYSKFNSKKSKIKKKFYGYLKNKLINSSKIKDKEKLDIYYKNYDYMPLELENHFDGDVSILFVDKKYRGKGFGKKLLLDILDEAKEEGVKCIRIMSDESCECDFYESIGCEKVYECNVINYESFKIKDKKVQKGYIYEKKL